MSVVTTTDDNDNKIDNNDNNIDKNTNNIDDQNNGNDNDITDGRELSGRCEVCRIPGRSFNCTPGLPRKPSDIGAAIYQIIFYYNII